MDELQLPHQFVDKLIERRGRRHIYEAVDPTTTALLVTDMQCAFLAPDGPMTVPAASGIVANINRLAAAVRRGGGLVAWLQVGYREGAKFGGWKTNYDARGSVETAERILDQLTEGHDGFQLWPEMDAQPGDLEITKYRYSAFVAGSSDLEAQLREREIDTVLVTGTLTNVCCESTARDAMQLGFKTMMISDATATHTQEEQVGTLMSIMKSFGDVRSTDEMIDLLAAAATSSSRAAE